MSTPLRCAAVSYCTPVSPKLRRIRHDKLTLPTRVSAGPGPAVICMCTLVDWKVRQFDNIIPHRELVFCCPSEGDRFVDMCWNGEIVTIYNIGDSPQNQERCNRSHENRVEFTTSVDDGVTRWSLHQYIVPSRAVAPQLARNHVASVMTNLPCRHESALVLGQRWFACASPGRPKGPPVWQHNPTPWAPSKGEGSIVLAAERYVLKRWDCHYI